MSPKLLAVDLDGTLLDPHGRPHARDVAAVRALMAAGVYVTIVTGRLYSGARAVAQALGVRGAVGCADGSHLVHARDDATLVHVGVRDTDARLLRDALARASLATFVFSSDAIGHDHAGAPYVDYVSTWSKDVRPAKDVFEHELWGAEQGITAAVALGTRARVDGLVDDLAERLPRAVLAASFPLRRGIHAGMWAVLVRAAGSTKGTAIRWISEHASIALHETVCVGDWVNDVPMFEVAGRSFAMGQAPDEVKAKATDVLDETVEQGGGVARAIERAFGVL